MRQNGKAPPANDSEWSLTGFRIERNKHGNVTHVQSSWGLEQLYAYEDNGQNNQESNHKVG